MAAIFYLIEEYANDKLFDELEGTLEAECDARGIERD